MFPTSHLQTSSLGDGVALGAVGHIPERGKFSKSTANVLANETLCEPPRWIF
jgi:hypothetical protein